MSTGPELFLEHDDTIHVRNDMTEIVMEDRSTPSVTVSCAAFTLEAPISITSPTVEINGATLVDVHGCTIQLNC